MVMVGVIVTGIHIWQRTDQAVQVPDHVRRQNSMNYIITGTDSAGALSLKRDSAAAAIKKAVELIGDGCREVCITDPDGRIHRHAEFDQLLPARRHDASALARPVRVMAGARPSVRR
jgi:hypothetical protein